MARLVAPSGSPIRGTLEKLAGVAQCGDITRNADGTLEFEYAGGTEVWWEDAITVERYDDGVKQTVFVDEDGEEWLASELVEEVDDEIWACPNCGNTDQDGSDECVDCHQSMEDDDGGA